MVKKNKTSKKIDFDSQVKSSVNALLKLIKSYPKKKSLIEDGETVFLQVALFKIPELNEFVKRRLLLKYPTSAEIPEVCLIVKDYIKHDKVRKTPEEKIDLTIERYEELLKKHNINGITNIMPYFQLKTEYDTFELKRKLVNRFDTFLCSSYLFSRDHFFNCLGKIFIEKNKYPIPVKLPSLNDDYDPKANSRVRSAIASTVFYIKPGSDNYSIRVGNTLRKKYLIENLKIVVSKLVESKDVVPGGFENIRSMNIKAERSKAVPLYMSMASGNNIPVPHVQFNVPVIESVEDEITTLPGRKVTVLPSGDIFVNPIRSGSPLNDGESNSEEEDEDDFEEEDDEEHEQEEAEEETVIENEGKKNKKQKTKKVGDGKKKGQRSKTADEDEDESEDAIDSAEQKYLSNLNDDSEDSEGEQEVEPKKSKGVKRKLKQEPKPIKRMKKSKAITKKPQKKTFKDKKSKKVKS